jgi:outer membrane protein assembly factor BamB
MPNTINNGEYADLASARDRTRPVGRAARGSDFCNPIPALAVWPESRLRLNPIHEMKTLKPCLAALLLLISNAVASASSSPVTDGELLFAHFGSRGLYCYDLNGELKWDKDLGDMRTRAGFGEGVSPALAGDRLIVNWDHEGQSFIVALDKQTGREIWRKNRDEQTSWTTPFIVEIEGKKQAIVAGTKKTRSYDVESGEVVWEASGQTANMIPTPVVGHGLVFLASGFRGNALQAIKLTAKGDVSGTGAIVWRHDRGTPYVPSTLLSGERLYFLKGNDAMISCFAAPTGKAHYEEERLEGLRGVYASPVGANGYVYILGRQGASVVIKDSPELTIVGRNKLDDRFDASPAIVGNHLYLRGHNNLYCIVEK